MYLEVSLHNHGEVGVVRLRHVLLVLAQLDGHDVAQVGTRVIPAKKDTLLNRRGVLLESVAGPTSIVRYQIQ